MTGNTIGDQKLAAFLIVEITDVHEEQTYAQYRERVPLTALSQRRSLLGSRRAGGTA
jgi:hypothetical protein